MELKRHLDFISITFMVIKWTFGQDTIYKINKILGWRRSVTAILHVDNIMLVIFKIFEWVSIQNFKQDKVSSTSVTNIDVTVEKFIEHCFKKFKKPLEPISNSFKSLKDFCHVIKVIFSMQWNALFYVSLWRKLYFCLRLHELV